MCPGWAPASGADPPRAAAALRLHRSNCSGGWSLSWICWTCLGDDATSAWLQTGFGHRQGAGQDMQSSCQKAVSIVCWCAGARSAALSEVDHTCICRWRVAAGDVRKQDAAARPPHWAPVARPVIGDHAGTQLHPCVVVCSVPCSRVQSQLRGSWALTVRYICVQTQPCPTDYWLHCSQHICAPLARAIVTARLTLGCPERFCILTLLCESPLSSSAAPSGPL
jgi:hypothetical protein